MRASEGFRGANLELLKDWTLRLIFLFIFCLFFKYKAEALIKIHKDKHVEKLSKSFKFLISVVELLLHSSV